MSETKSLFARYRERMEGCGSDTEKLALQKEVLLPLILEEKQAFIKAEYGRLQQIMGAEYSEGDEVRVFHPLPENQKNGEERVYGNPEELTLAELAMLPHLTHKINRLGTVSFMHLIQCYPEDKFRMQLLADLYEKLMVDRLCSDQEAKMLLNGHSEYMQLKQPRDVVVIK